MKLFWIIMALLAAATAVLWLTGGRDSMSPTNHHVANPGKNSASATRREVSQAADDDASESKTFDIESDSAGTAKATGNSLSHPSSGAPDDAISDVHADAGVGDVADNGRGAESNALAIERRPDGSILLDRRFPVRGSGTERDPYRITWDLLLSAEETYSPAQDTYEMPDRITFLDGKHVQIEGYLFTAMLQDETSELLVMQNMWDGCCIGLPPSAYDGIEVNLRKPLVLTDLGLLELGVLRGKLRVDPYVQEGWLLGLYVMDDGIVDFGEM